MKFRFSFFALIVAVLSGCSLDQRKQNVLFDELSPDETGLKFVNEIRYDKNFNIFRYRNFYNGGGVAIGDINNDGLSDVFVTSNFDDNKLFLNKGNFKFEDITEKAGLEGKHAWSTGATFADVNGDGLVDIYVCNAGNRTDANGEKDDRSNELYLNNGNLTFTEKAKEYGLDDKGFSTHAAFFDYDRDGDLDMYLLNNSFIPINSLKDQNLRNERDNLGGDKFFRNDGAKFTDISAEAGIYGSLIGFGLGITVGDVNNDNWLDIYVSNDFYERDYLYINQKNGTFKESLTEQMNHISASSMGADVADINNDGLLDIFVTDMLPGDDKRLKTTSTFEDYNYFNEKVRKDFHYQYMRNMLHLNNGNGTFAEVGCLAGVQATDWSWGALMFDMDNDGQKDIFVANGIAKNLTDQDFVSFLASEETMQQAILSGGVNYKMLIDKITEKPIANYAFRNEGNLQFKSVGKDWGLDRPGYSNGAAYGDLDNDGDLDLIVNNVNAPLGVFKNNSREKFNTHYLRINLKGTAANKVGIGAGVYVYQGGKMQFQQQMPNRGFQSSSDQQLIFGLGDNAKIDSLRIVWPNDHTQTIKNPQADRALTLNYTDAKNIWQAPVSLPNSTAMTDVTASAGLNFVHTESNFVDFYRDILLKSSLSTQGPAVAVGDVNGDGQDDIYIGNTAGKARKLFLKKGEKFIETTVSTAPNTEETGATFFDADNDKDLDLLIVTGSNEYMGGSPELSDKLYLNDGKGKFTPDSRFPDIRENGSCAVAADIDNDGDQDLFIGTRMVSGEYGNLPQSHVLLNTNGVFRDETARLMPEAKQVGMVTDATWADVNNDRLPDLLLTQDWGTVAVFQNQAGRVLKLNQTPALKTPETGGGLWTRIKAADLDGDGDLDFVLGNQGQNSRLRATEKQPAELWTCDFDRNGTVEQIISCYTEDGKAYPMVLKPDLQKQLPSIKKKFVLHADYANKTVQDIFDSDILKTAQVAKIGNTNTCVLWNEGNFNFKLEALPIEAQFSPIFGIETTDINQDGRMDILLAGNFFDLIPEMGRYDANYGLVLLNEGNRQFVSQKSGAFGFFVRGQVRHLRKVGNSIVAVKNNDKAQVFALKKP